MNAVLKLVAVLVMAAGVVVEGEAYIPAPGLALVFGTLVALYLWFLSKVRPYLRPKS